ncbi:AAA family ATPase [Spirosoma aerolatum]|uniref:AAA family ATPase n=1 Tax=Spirosoma aerolatum TaxID=1211326 RepID=UPI0009AD65DE|nr:AAA family ATPase [Spirosoma aerolatum]
MNAQIINARQFNSVEEYKAATGLQDVPGEWMDLARHLGVPINPKGGRRSIYDAWKAQQAQQDGTTADTPKKSVATKVKATTVQVPVVTPEPETSVIANAAPEVVAIPDKPKTKAPRRMDFQNEEEFDAAMTEYVLANPRPEKPAGQHRRNYPNNEAGNKQFEAAKVEWQNHLNAKTVDVAVNPAPVANIAMVPTDVDNVEETARQLAKLLAGLTPKPGNAQIDPAQVAQMIQDAVKEETKGIHNILNNELYEYGELLKQIKQEVQNNTTTIHVKVNDKAAVQVDGLVHERFEDILKHVAVRDHVMLVGPAGSGKTTVCENVAQALALDFYCKSVCAQTSKSELLGYMDANGNFVSTEFRVAYENGGVFVLDEIDAGNPNVIAVLNSALANNYCAFADGMIRKHEDFVLIACANTFGTGASREYVGRNQLDSATLDRFSVIEFGYDEKLETALSPDKTFCQFVQAVRKELANERIVISPRASIQGGKLLAAGCTPQYVMQTRIIKGINASQADRVKAVFARFYKK